MNKSILTKHQVKNFSREFYQDGILCKLVVNVRYDDRCGNGHNTFAITADLFDRCHRNREPSTELSTGKRRWLGSWGCLHGKIKKVYPEMAKYIKWHSVSSDGPMYYIENTMYDIEQGDLDAARATAIWPEASTVDLCREHSTVVADLNARLPGLMEEFKAAIEELGFIY
ncbi:MAG: hypothetical protein PHG61_09690 [Candidatus Marinimicrobia bacterium]|nr:hypothetical protein [Candidatus Neomarinimicrobiota bacterium]